VLYSDKHGYGSIKAKQLFLDELRIESPEMEQLYKDEFTGTQAIPSSAERLAEVLPESKEAETRDDGEQMEPLF
jgi:hypothetical protein